MFNLINKIKCRIKAEKTDVNNCARVTNRTKKFQESTDSILNRLENTEHRKELDSLKEILDTIEKDITLLPSKVAVIDEKFNHLTKVLEDGKTDTIISLEVNEYRFKYGDLLVDLICHLDKKHTSIDNEEEREKTEKLLVMSFVDYAKRFDNKRARLTDESNDKYVNITSKYTDEPSNIITKEFED